VSEEILDSGPAEISLVAGGGGIFDVKLDGELIFSKAASERFPEPGEIAALIAQRSD
jgi:selenoprotein W-related protein